MSDEKGKVTDKASEIAKNIWLAGVGAYGKAAGDAQDRLEKAGVETPKLFKDLVKAGAALEDEARENIASLRSASSSVEERINRVRDNFSLHRLGRSDDLASLHAKIDLLSKKIDLLATVLTEPPTKTRKKPATAKKKAPAARPATRKKSATSTRAKTKKS